MARNNQNKRSKEAYGSNKFEYHNIHFTDQQKNVIAEYLYSLTTGLLDGILTLADLGFRVTFSLNSWTGLYQISVTCKDPKKPLFNRCLSYEHVDVERLMGIMLWVILEQYDGGRNWIEPEKQTVDW